MNRKPQTLFQAALCFALLLLPDVVAAGDLAAEYSEARAAFDKARAGDDSASDLASELFTKLSQRDPQNPLYLAYCGASWTLRAKAAWAPWTKLKYVERGLDMIDRAMAMLKPAHDEVMVRHVPLSIDARLVSAATYIALPGSFNRIEDGKAVIASALASPALAQAPAGVQAALYFQAALAARQDKLANEEAQALRTAISLQSTGPLADKARARLKELAQ